MGLCKCPKRKVTTLFCFEHSVNVCEYCMVVNHPKCIVQSYIHWLKDSDDYNPNCKICLQPLETEECARLVCFHVFHWQCLNGRFMLPKDSRRPEQNSLYKCPECERSILPRDNIVSPVADALREKLLTANWARVAMGLPEIENEDLPTNDFPSQNPSKYMQPKEDIVLHVNENDFPRMPDENLSFNRPQAQYSRRMLHSSVNPKLLLVEEDESKYRRRYSLFGVPRWIKSAGTKMCSMRKNPWKLLTGVIIVLLIWIFFSVMGTDSGQLHENSFA